MDDLPRPSNDSRAHCHRAPNPLTSASPPSPMNLPRTFSALSLLALLASATAAPPDWPQWRGVNRDGLSPETGLLKEWPADGPPLAWKMTGIGKGMGSVSIHGGRLFVLGKRKD